MANYYVKRQDQGLATTEYMSSDGLDWVTDSGAAWVTTTQADSVLVAAALNKLQRAVSFIFAGRVAAPYVITSVTF